MMRLLRNWLVALLAPIPTSDKPRLTLDIRTGLPVVPGQDSAPLDPLAEVLPGEGS